MKTITVNIVTPDGPVYDSEESMVIAVTATGEMGVLPGQIPTVAPLGIGAVRLKKENSTELVAVNGGFLEIRPEKVTILAQSAERATDIDLARAQESAKRAEALLQANKDEIDFKRAELALKRAMNRINVYEGNV